ncbi:MAG: acyltransferase [Bacteroides sp.]|nr:acyltransferase [Bacteroides sp.]MCM1413902.1 acyltransferase [Bacteroides sp.]
MKNAFLKNIANAVVKFLKGNFYPVPYINNVSASETTSGKRRIEFIDLAKGVCIIMVVIMHCPRVSIDLPGISAMRMPLYFLLSGLFFKDYGGIYSLIEKKLNKIILPFLFFAAIDVAWTWIAKHRLDINQFAGMWGNGQTLHNIPLWFLPALFLSNIVFCLLCNSLRSGLKIAAGVGVLSAVGCMLTLHHIYLPFYLTQALNGLPFFYLGYISRKLPLLYPSRYDWAGIIVGACLVALASWICTIPATQPHLDYYHNTFSANAWLYYPVAIMMVSGILLVCKTIRWLPIVSYFGRYSIIVLGLHQMFIFQFKWAKVPEAIGPMIGMNLLLAVLLACWILIPVLTGLLPMLTAQKDLIKLPRFNSRMILRRG